MIYSYILTAVLSFGTGIYLESLSCNKRLRNYKKKLIATLDYYKTNKNTENILILDLEDDK
jgi:hypothetical protein